MFNAFAKQLTWHFALLQVHKLDKKAWESVEVVDIDIADRKQVNAKVKTKKKIKKCAFWNKPKFQVRLPSVPGNLNSNLNSFTI